MKSAVGFCIQLEECDHRNLKLCCSPDQGRNMLANPREHRRVRDFEIMWSSLSISLVRENANPEWLAGLSKMAKSSVLARLQPFQPR